MNSFIISVLILYFCYTSISGQTPTEPSLFPHSDNSSNSSHLYCLGGENENDQVTFSVSQLNTTDKQWKALHGMPTSKEVFGATAIGKKIYVCGGYIGKEDSNLMEVFDCEHNTWSELAPMPSKRREHGMTTLNGNIYVTGGYDASNHKLSSVLKYSPETSTWTEVKPMNEEREDHELVTLDDYIYAIAGFQTNTVERYSPLIDKWGFVAPTHYNHFYFGATSHQNKIYVLSEFGFEVFDPQSDTWQELPKLNIGQGTQLVSINDKLWALGGYGSYKAVHEFNTSNNSWIQLPDMDVGRAFHRAVVVNF